MKRPFVVIGFTALITALYLVSVASTVLSVCGIIAFAMGLALSLAVKRGRVSVVTLLCIGGFVACTVTFFACQTKSRAVECCGENKKVEAVICESPEFSPEKGRHYVTARLLTLSEERVHGKIRLSFSETYDEISSSDFKIGDRVSFMADTYEIAAGSDDVNLYYASEGIFLGGYSISDIKIKSPSVRPPSYYADALREKIVKAALKEFPNKTGGVIISMLTGDKSHVDSDLYLSFKRSGAAHMLAVSGMHLSVWIMFMMVLLGASSRKRWYSELILALTVVFIMFLASFSPSVVRSGIMCMVTLLGNRLSREGDGLNSLGFASLIMVVYNPYISVNVAFQLSFMSVLGIFILALPLNKVLGERLLTKIPSLLLQKMFSVACCSVAVSISVTLFTFPILALAFGGVSLVSPLTNLLLLPIASPVVILSGLNSLVADIPLLSEAVAFILKLLCEYMIFVVEFAGSAFFSYMPYTVETFVFWCFAFLTALTLIFLLIYRRLNIRRYSALAIALAFVFAGYNYLTTSLSSYSIVHVSESSYVVTMNGRGVLVGVGDDYFYEGELAEILEQRRIRPDAVLLMENDDKNTADYICADYGIDNVIDSPGGKITLFDCVEIESFGTYAVIKGNGAEFVVFQNNGLQQENDCAIIHDNIGLTFYDAEVTDGAVVCNAYTDTTINVSEKGKISFRGENFG